jgi:uncharacterized protein
VSVQICDAHCHYFSARFFETLAAELPGPSRDSSDDLIRRLGWDDPGAPEALADRWAAELDRHGVARAALIASVPGDEASVGAAVARYPRRFTGWFMVDPTRDGASERVARAFDELGLRGVCLFPAMHRYAVDDSRVLRVMELAASCSGAVVFVHCGMLSVGARQRLGLPSRFDIRLGDPLAVRVVASAFPRLPVIIPHFGAGCFRETLMAADGVPNIHLDTSSSNGWIKYHPGLTLEEVFRRALQVVGPDRLLFGTDSSFFPRGWQRPVLEAQQRALAAIGLPAGDEEKIFGGNFNRLFPA